MWDIIREITVKVCSKFLKKPPNSGENTLPVTTPNSAIQINPMTGLLVQIRDAPGEVYRWLISNVHVREASNDMNSIALRFQSQELSKAVLGLIVPITGMLLDNFKDLTLLQSRFIIITLSLGFAAIFNGVLLKDVYKKAAAVMEKMGVALIFLCLFILISSSLPPALAWVCWLCFALSCVPLLLCLRQDLLQEITHSNTNSPRPLV